MTEENRIPDRSSDLRQRAEEMLRKQHRELDKIPSDDVQRIVHDLQVHQIELEMQNEELRRTQQELEVSREKYFSLYDLAPVGYVTLNEKGIILDANLTAPALLGTERSGLITQPLTRFIFREDQDAYYFYQKRLSEIGRHQECEVRMLKEDGTQFWARLDSIAATGNDGEPACRTAIIDVTRIKQSEEELVQDREHLEYLVKERTSELTFANEQLEAFNSSVSHDLRAPLRHMRSFLELLQKDTKGQLSEKGRHYSVIISAAVKKMESLIDGLLSFSRIGSGEIPIREVNLSKLLKETIREILDETPNQTNKRDIIWKIGNLPNVYGEQSLLKLALVNLISNAVKFTSTRPHAEIEIGYKADGDEVVFFIKDNGIGFDMKYAERLFGLFQRLHTQDEFEGTGVGLANVRRIISRHGGKVWAEGAQGQGSTFYFTLPKREEREREA